MAKKKKISPDELAKAMRGSSDGVKSDVLGSYTGTPEGGGVPVQDADDL